jgi:O-antigen ligase
MRTLTPNARTARAPRGGGGIGELVLAGLFGFVAAVLAIYMPAFLGPILTVILLLAVGLMAVSTRFDVHAVASSFLIFAAFTTPMNRIFVGPAAISDFSILAATGLYAIIRLVEGRKMEEGTYRPIMIGLAIIALGGLIGSIFEAPGVFMYKALAVPIRDISGWGPNLANLGKFMAGAFIPMTMWWLARPGRQLMRRVLVAFVCGSVLSGLAGLFDPTSKGAGRSYGLTVHPGQFGSLCVVGFGVSLALLLSRPPFRAWGLFALPVLALGVLTSGSRAALGALVVLALILGPLTRRRVVMGFVMTAAAVVLVLLLVGGIKAEGENALGRALGSDPHAENSSEIRADLGNRVLDRWEQRPITGNGFNYMKPSHNVYLGLLASTGFLGIVGFITIVTTIVRRTWRRREDLMVVGTTAAYLAYLTAAYFDNIFWERWLWFTVGMVVAVIATRPLPGEVGYEAPEDEVDPELTVSTR